MDLMQRRRQIMMAASPLVEMTATGNPAVFTSKARKAYTSLKAGFLPVQNLNGYEHPWPAGGGKNKFNTDFSDTTINDTVITKLSDGKVSTSGVPTSAFDYVIGTVTLPAGDYILNGCPAGGGATKYRLQVTDFPIQLNLGQDSGSGVSFTLSEEMVVAVRIQVYTGASASLTYAPMIRLASETDASFAPYSNICPITGWTGVQVSRTGKNLFDKSNTANILNDAYLSGATIEESAQRSVVFIPCKPNRIYTASRKAVMANDRFAIGYTTARPAIGVAIKNLVPAPNDQTIGNLMSISVTTGNDAKYVVVWAYWGNRTDALDDLQLELGSTATTYEPYTGTTVSVDWTSEAGTVYGGYVDLVNGQLVVDSASVDLGTLTWYYFGNTTPPHFGATVTGMKMLTDNIFCSAYEVVKNAPYGNKDKTIRTSDMHNQRGINVNDTAYTDVASFKSAMSGVQFVYELAEPITYTLTAQQIQALLGTNTVFSDANDDIEVKYLTRN